MDVTRRLGLCVAATVAVAGLSTAGNAATTIACADTDAGACTFDGTTGLFGGTVKAKSSVADIFDFTTTSAGSFTFDITSNKLTINSASFNGASFSPTFGDSYTFNVDAAGTYALDLTVSNTTSKQSTFSGTTDFTAAVPETATWAMMVLGFGAIGGMMRRAHRKSEEHFTSKVRAFAAA